MPFISLPASMEIGDTLYCPIDCESRWATYYNSKYLTVESENGRRNVHKIVSGQEDGDFRLFVCTDPDTGIRKSGGVTVATDAGTQRVIVTLLQRVAALEESLDRAIARLGKRVHTLEHPLEKEHRVYRELADQLAEELAAEELAEELADN